MIKFLDLKSVNKRFESEFKNGFSAFLNSGQYILGDQVAAFEEEFASFCGTAHCIGLSSGLDALRLIFEAYKILGKLKAGDEVIVPANTYIASVLAIGHAGLKPVLVEPSIASYNIDAATIEQAITANTRAILGVHLYGQLYAADALETLCKEKELLLIEDAAQAHGAVCSDGRKAGNLSDAAAFSFYPTKNLGALGDAGAVTTNDKELAETIEKLRNYGRTSTYKNDLKGFNCRLDELQAVFLRIKLKHLDVDNECRRNMAKYYLEHITSQDIILPTVMDYKQHVFHLFVIRSNTRDELKDYLYKHGVETLVHYPVSIHQQHAYKEYKDYKLPVTEQLQQEVLSLPLHTLLKQQELFKIISFINNF